MFDHLVMQASEFNPTLCHSYHIVERKHQETMQRAVLA